MRSLPDTSHEHHEQIEPHVDRLPQLAEMIGRVTPEAFSESFQEECSFIIGQLVPHMEAIETTLYGRLEQVMDHRHSMAPMRRVLYRLYAMLKVHLAEEALYLGVLERNLSAEEKDTLAQGIDHAGARPL